DVNWANFNPLGRPPIDTTSSANAVLFGGSDEVEAQAAYQISLADAYQSVDVTQAYQLSGWARSGDGVAGAYDSNNLQYFGYASYDIDKNEITPLNVTKVIGAQDAHLAQA